MPSIMTAEELEKKQKGMRVENMSLMFNNMVLDPKLYDPHNFTYYAYQSQLQMALDAGYSFIKLDDATANSSKTIALTHNIAFSPTAAMRLAKINKKKEVRGTFYFSADNPFYKLDGRDVSALVIMGQDIGLQIDVGQKALKKEGVDNYDHGKVIEIIKTKLDRNVNIIKGFGVPISPYYSVDVTGLHEVKFDIQDFPEHNGMMPRPKNVFADGIKRKPLSDSNGMHIWGQNLQDMIKAGVPHINQMAQPCWWSEEPILPH